MKNKINKELINEIEKEYGEDVGDYLHSIEEMLNKGGHGWNWVLYDKDVLFIYWGDEDVTNSDIIFRNEVRLLRHFDSENGFEIRDLFKAIEVLSE